jgi:hypothetical protein
MLGFGGRRTNKESLRGTLFPIIKEKTRKLEGKKYLQRTLRALCNIRLGPVRSGPVRYMGRGVGAGTSACLPFVTVTAKGQG